jgi:RNA polymerase sigma-70 factor, ECF subfamily
MAAQDRERPMAFLTAGCSLERGGGRLMSDEALVRRFQQGEEAAFDELLERHRARIYGLVCRLAGSNEAEDLAQDVFVAAYRSLRAFRGEAAFGTWLYRIAIHTCSHHLRRKRPEALELDETEPDQRRDGDPLARAMQRELQSEVRRAIDGLPYKLRVVIVLRDMHGLSYEEIAGVIGCPVGTVRSRLHYASQKLAVELRQYVEAA